MSSFAALIRNLHLVQVIALLILNCLCYAVSGEKKELEDALAAHREESKKELDAASRSAAARERGYANQLAALVQAMGGECFFIYSLICRM